MIEVGNATLADSRRIAEIQVTGWQAGYRGILPDEFLGGLDTESRLAMWERFIRTGKGLMLVARRGGQLLGFCHVIPSRDADAEQTAEITAIYVDPRFWRNGCGRKLVAAALAWAFEQGFRQLTLWVLADNSRGRGFYEAIGMRPDGAVKTEDRPGCSLHEVRYRIELKRPAP